ncbi:hypothetical protein Cadr_000012389 [Camelus dromedarius]|uniref:Uncharacterized protein n=1 Tax=Camelus dromedarius TaxID=9838 RepID=A0A5N4DSC1_CAMDR|nr:hypothetical protein Cadr_000012389 [Camelus dromedarius]
MNLEILTAGVKPFLGLALAGMSRAMLSQHPAGQGGEERGTLGCQYCHQMSCISCLPEELADGQGRKPGGQTSQEWRRDPGEGAEQLGAQCSKDRNSPMAFREGNVRGEDCRVPDQLKLGRRGMSCRDLPGFT